MLNSMTNAAFARSASSICAASRSTAFASPRILLIEIAQRMDRLPAWKQAAFSERYFTVDADFLSGALALRPTDLGLAVYLKSVFEDERLLEATLNELVSRPEIDLRRPVTAADWSSWVFKSDSPLANKASADYAEATREQAEVCERLFRLPVSVVTGPAGTGKTTIIEALIRAVRRAEGESAAVLVLAPTGKAADRAREVFEKASLQRVETVTVTFLPRRQRLAQRKPDLQAPRRQESGRRDTPPR